MSHDPKCRLFVAGTVALPPRPIVATLTLEDTGLAGPDDKIVCITQTRDPQDTISRRVLAKHVNAIEVIEPPAPGAPQPSEPRKEWKLGRKAIEDYLVQAQTTLKLVQGTAYVTESASVSTSADFGVTAADSAEFRPPTSSWPKPGCDA